MMGLAQNGYRTLFGNRNTSQTRNTKQLSNSNTLSAYCTQRRTERTNSAGNQITKDIYTQVSQQYINRRYLGDQTLSLILKRACIQCDNSLYCDSLIQVGRPLLSTTSLATSSSLWVDLNPVLELFVLLNVVQEAHTLRVNPGPSVKVLTDTTHIMIVVIQSHNSIYNRICS